jgi:hypothetical protein
VSSFGAVAGTPGAEPELGDWPRSLPVEVPFPAPLGGEAGLASGAGTGGDGVADAGARGVVVADPDVVAGGISIR